MCIYVYIFFWQISNLKWVLSVCLGKLAMASIWYHFGWWMITLKKIQMLCVRKNGLGHKEMPVFAILCPLRMLQIFFYCMSKFFHCWSPSDWSAFFFWEFLVYKFSFVKKWIFYLVRQKWKSFSVIWILEILLLSLERLDYVRDLIVLCTNGGWVQ